MTMSSSASEARHSEEGGLKNRIPRLAALIASASPGRRAALRRLTPQQAPPLGFYRFAVFHLPERWETQAKDWITLVAGMAVTAPAIHRPDRGLGRVLGETGYSEARLERLLSAEDDARRTLFLRAVRFLAAKSASFNWLDAARLLFARTEGARERIRARIAREYYSALPSDKEKKTL